MQETPAAYFEELWSASPDPWEHSSRWYEARKYDLTVAALPAAHYRRAVEPACGVGLLTCGIDVQDDRIEAIVRGWGEAEESWLIAQEVFLGDVKDPSDRKVWEQLDRFLAQRWKHEAGPELGLDTTCIDSSAYTDAVYKFCKPRFGRREASKICSKKMLPSP